jgi:hypothetical protein
VDLRQPDLRALTADRCYHGWVRIAAIAVAVVALTGCFPEGSYECDTDGECSGGEVCARTHECLLASDVRAVTIRWTIDGQTDTGAACRVAGVDGLEIEFSGGAGEALRFAPVPCQGGLYFMDKLPLRFNAASLSGTATSGVSYYGSTVVGTDPEYTIALAPF